MGRKKEVRIKKGLDEYWFDSAFGYVSCRLLYLFSSELASDNVAGDFLLYEYYFHSSAGRSHPTLF